VWDAATGAPSVEYREHSREVNAARWAPDGQSVISASGDGTVQRWDATTGQRISTFSGHKDAVYAAMWSPDGKRVVSGGGDEKALVWDPDTDEIKASYEGHMIKGTVDDGSPTGLVHTVAWAPDNTRLASASLDKTAHIWRLP
jgi:WD40 repeat protein